MIGCLGVHPSLVEQVSGYDHEVDPSRYSVTFQHFTPGAKEIQGPIRQIVPSYAKMNISDMKESRHCLCLPCAAVL